MTTTHIGASVQRMTTRGGMGIAYCIDDSTDPWKRAPTLVMLHTAVGSMRRLFAMVP